MEEQLEILRKWMEESRYAVFFGGAGVSTESGIPDFRSQDGLYHQEYAYPPETIVSHSFFLSNTEEFFTFYRKKLLAPEAKPNAAHRKLAQWEREGWLKAVITQNIDGLHQAAGSREVLELHGSVHRNYCTRCGAFYDMEHMLRSTGIPCCHCGGVIKPGVVLYEEALDQKVLEKAVQHLRKADLLLVGGTSLAVYPAAGLLRYYGGTRVAVINKTPLSSALPGALDLCAPIGETFSKLP